jgi:RNA polymerase sigma-70 factor, ECF subfamily
MTARAPNTESSHDDLIDHHGINEHRPRLLGLAYRMLGDVDEAEDVVQEAFLRWQLADQHAIRSPEAWLMTVVTRLSVDRLRRLKTERSTYPGPWLPEPIATDPALAPATPPAPDHAAELASDLSVALLVLLERLAPEERAAFLLREVFDSEYEEIAQILQRSSDAVRKMVHRARTRVRNERTRVVAPPGEHERLLERFVDAITADDAPALLALLAPDVALASDGGGQARAARQWLLGPDRVARFVLGVTRKFGHDYSRRFAQLNGRPAMLVFSGDVLVSATTVDVQDGRIRALHIMRNPDKLRHALHATVRLV